jgi:DNA replication and repair protein RecF
VKVPAQTCPDIAEPSAAGLACAGDTTAASAPWVEQLALTDFRNYARLELSLAREPIVVCGPNGSGKTNLLEAVSLLAPGQGLRRVPYPDLMRTGTKAWRIAAVVRSLGASVTIGTGFPRTDQNTARQGRIVRINGVDQAGSGALGDYLDALWLTPTMDALFTGPAADRRRFLDRLTAGLDPGYRLQLGRFERAMQHRNRLLVDDVRQGSRFEELERIMAESAVAVAAARCEALRQLQAAIDRRETGLSEPAFPWAEVAVADPLGDALCTNAAVDVEDAYARALAAGRERDRAAGRTLEGPHRADLLVGHGPKGVPAKVCSTGEQKALLVGLTLAQAALVRRLRNGLAPILLLDEIAAHLDSTRRAALFEAVLKLGNQTWMTGTERELFAPLERRSQRLVIEDGRVTLVQGSSC